MLFAKKQELILGCILLTQNYCMQKSQFDSTDIYSDKSQSQNQILFRIDSGDRKYIKLLNNAEGSDFTIMHGHQSYPLHKTIIFKHMSLHILDLQLQEGVIKVPDNFNNDLVKGIISSLYGLEFKIKRSQGLQALDIVQFLQISKYKKIMQEDIVQNFEDYQLFPLLQKAKQYGMQDIYDLCIEQLDRESYQQVRYCKFHLLSCREDVFKEVVNKHNQRKWEDPGFGLGDKLIQDLILEYCRHNNYNERQKHQLIREFNEMQTKSDFPSSSYGQFLSPIPPLKFKGSDKKISIKVYTPRTSNTNFFQTNPQCFDVIRQEDISSKSMIVDMTYVERERIKSRSVFNLDVSDVFKLTCEVFPLKDENKTMQKQYETMRSTIDKMSKTLRIKEEESTNNKYQLSEIQRLMEDCETSLMENNRMTRLLEVRANKMQIKMEKYKNRSQLNEQQCDEQSYNSIKDQKLSVSLIESKWVCC